MTGMDLTVNPSFLGPTAPLPAGGPSGTFAVERHPAIAYRTGPGADPDRHRLDVYRPCGLSGYPVVLFAHGGGWRSGDKDLYAPLGEAFAKEGIGVVVCNYRLSPGARHPAHAEDVAGAFAWTHSHIGEFGGRPDNLFLAGHSAGGHLVSLLATDPRYLNAENRSPSDIRGVVAISGVYVILPVGPLFRPAFGGDLAGCAAASPLTHVRGGHPPFLIAYAADDYPHLDTLAGAMHGALRQAGSPAELIRCADRDHISIITGLVEDTDPLNRAVRGFIKSNSK